MIVTRKAPSAPHLPARSRRSSLALPILDSMAPAFADTTKAAAAANPPSARFVYVPNGIIQSSWLPKTQGPELRVQCHRESPRALPRADSGAQQSGADQRPLPRRSRDHARAGATWLTGVHPKKTEGAEFVPGFPPTRSPRGIRCVRRERMLGQISVGESSGPFRMGWEYQQPSRYTLPGRKA